MEKNESLVLDILNYGSNGEGVAKTEDGKIAFIPYSLKGEKVFATCKKSAKSFVECSVKEIVKSSNFRQEPLCKYYGCCGGCQLQHAEYNHSLEVKREIVQNAVSKIGKLDAIVLPTIASTLDYGYRNKISVPINFKTKSISMHDNNNNLIDIEDCVIVGNWCKKLIKTTNTFIKRYNISVYEEGSNKGLLKQLVARKVGECLLVSLIINGEKLDHYEEYFAMLLTEFESVGLSVIINCKPSSYLPNGKFIHLCGCKNAEIDEFGLRYTINNACFMQVNTEIKKKIYEQVIDECSGFDLCIDCYSGAGVLTALISKSVKKAIGVEIVEEATKAANKLCEYNNVLNVQNICGDSAKVLSGLNKEIENNKTVVVLDPPRKGCDKSLLQTLNENCVNKIIYVSCDPSTLARDLNILCALKDSKYKINFIRPYDMFPQTKHVETVVSLSLKN